MGKGMGMTKIRAKGGKGWVTYSHGQQTGLVVLQIEVLVGELVGAVDGAGAGAVAVDEVAALEHEVFDLKGVLAQPH